jgi:hypothetical protein
MFVYKFLLVIGSRILFIVFISKNKNQKCSHGKKEWKYGKASIDDGFTSKKNCKQNAGGKGNI